MAAGLGFAVQGSLNQSSMLPEDDTDCEVFRQRFRQFQYKEAAGPREAFNKLWELCSQWLQPQMRSKEQILELLVLEQFLNILPTEIETRVRLCNPENRERIWGLIEDLETELGMPREQGPKQEMLLEEQERLETIHMLPHNDLESPALQVPGFSQGTTLGEEWFSQEGLQELSYSAAGEYQPFLEPGYLTEKADVSLPLDPSEFLLERDLQNSKEIKQLLDSKTCNYLLNTRKESKEKFSLIQGFDLGEENEENTSKQKKLEDTYSFTFTFEGTTIHVPISQKDYEQLKYQPEIHPDELQSDFTELVADENHSLGEKPEVSNLEETLQSDFTELVADENHSLGEQPEVSNLEETLTSRPHIQKCPGEKPHHSQSGKCSSQNSQLSRDQKFHSGKEPHKCPECEKSFLLISNLYRHQRLHARERPYECTVCKKRFARQSHLIGHQRTHSKDEIYNCLECGKNFCHVSSLKRHMNTHTGEKPHRCQSCGKSFFRVTALTLHERTHTEERPFQCDYCGKTYRQRASLMLHLRIHTGEKPYKCSHCSECFIKRKGLIVHQMTHLN